MLRWDSLTSGAAWRSVPLRTKDYSWCAWHTGLAHAAMHLPSLALPPAPRATTCPQDGKRAFTVTGEQVIKDSTIHRVRGHGGEHLPTINHEADAKLGRPFPGVGTCHTVCRVVVMKPLHGERAWRRMTLHSVRCPCPCCS